MRSKRLQFTLAANEDGGRRGGYAWAVSNSYDMAAGTAKAGPIQIDLSTGRTCIYHSSSITLRYQMKQTLFAVQLPILKTQKTIFTVIS